MSSAWKDSRESRTSEFQKFHFTTRYQGYEQRWHPMDHQELHLYLVGESHVVLRNIQFRKKGHNRNLIINPGRISIEGDSSTGWLIQGNHADSFIENERLHLIAHGHGDNRANRAEIDLTELSPGATYEIDFEARWVHGSPRFIVRTWENSLSESVLLPIPRNLGTPGAPNSNLRSYPSPLVETLLQSPAVGAPSKPLSITASVGWPAETGIVNLVYRLDGAPDSPWNREPMAPRKKTELLDHSLTTYQAILEREFKQGQLIQYYVEAISRNGQRNTLPRKPISQPALCIFDGREIPRDLRVIRMLISDHHLQTFSNTASQKYQYRYPRLSNQYFNSTFISNERDVFHGAELRTSGSPWTRRQPLDRGKFRLPKDRLFRDHGIKAGARAKGNNYLLDILPTVCDLAGIDIPETVQGKSVKPVLMGKAPQVRNVLYGAYCGGTKPGMRSVRKGDWKLIKYDTMEGTVRKTQLFNLKQNPEELLAEHQSKNVISKTGNTPSKNQVNLAGNPKHAKKLKEMESLLLGEMKRLQDPYHFWDQPED